MPVLSINKCVELLKAAGCESVAGRTLDETATSLCMAAAFHKAAEVGLTPEVFAELRASRWPGLAKAVSGGFQHMVSVDNGAVYAELWAKGDNWYAVTGATNKSRGGIHGISGVKKGMSARDAVPLFLEAVFTRGARPCCGG